MCSSSSNGSYGGSFTVPVAVVMVVVLFLVVVMLVVVMEVGKVMV